MTSSSTSASNLSSQPAPLISTPLHPLHPQLSTLSLSLSLSPSLKPRVTTMYTHNSSMFAGDYHEHYPSTADGSGPSNFPSLLSPPPPLIITDNFGYNEFDSVMKSEVCGSSDSYVSTSSLASYGTLEQNGFCPPVYSPGTLPDFLESEAGSVRRVYSAGDLNRINVMQQSYQRSDSPLSNESSSSIIEGMMTKACRYNPEEKKERIEKYRSKRTQRNFNKKIKYACRKTLADSRPRIRGRFARNEEFEKSSDDQVQCSHTGGEEDDEDDDNWAHFLDTLSANLNS